MHLCGRGGNLPGAVRAVYFAAPVCRTGLGAYGPRLVAGRLRAGLAPETRGVVVDVSARRFLRAPAGLACAHLRAGTGSGTFRYRCAPNFLELRCGEVLRIAG